MDRFKIQRTFSELTLEDKDLTMFTVTDLSLAESEESNLVYMAIKLKRKVTTELLTTFLPTLLLLLIVYATNFFNDNLFSDAIAVNLTIMLVMTTIFTSKIEELPPTSDMKMIDIWLIFCLVVPFLAVVLRTAIESMSCSCRICESKNENESGVEDKGDEKDEKHATEEADIQRVSQGVWIGAVRVAPVKVANSNVLIEKYNGW